MSKYFHRLLSWGNFFTSLFFTIVGTAVLFYGVYECVKALKIILLHNKPEGKILSEVLKGVDLIFLGIVIHILGVGLYELFVKPIENLPEWLTIKNFDHLKTLLVKASITVVTISFVGKAVTWDGSESIAYYGVGIGAVIAALSYFIKSKNKAKR